MKTRASGFSRWLFKQHQSSLAFDAKRDVNWPREATRFIDFWRYLEPYDDSVKDELCSAWNAWTGKLPPRPDIIDTDVVYEKQCDFINFGDPYPEADSASRYLYALVEIEKEFDMVRVRYVGQTNCPSRRLIDHITKPGTLERVKWLGALLNRGELPQMAIFDTVSRNVADEMELAAIYAFSECETYWNHELNGFPPLDDTLLNVRR